MAPQLELDFDAGRDIEQRSFATAFESRATESRTVYGYAAVFNQQTDMGWYIEEIAPGAFDEAITRSDARALFNHKPDNLLARQSSGTLKLEIDEKGLKYEFEAPDTQLGNDVLELIKRGDLKESSFAFTVQDQEWREVEQDGKMVYYRTITKVKELYDVSPVTYPAYATTTVAKRSFEKFKGRPPVIEEEEEHQDEFMKQREGRDACILAILYS